MMRRQLDDLRSRGEAVAVLYASEGGIYGRYGYGPATFGARYVVDKRLRAAPAWRRGRGALGPGAQPPGSVRLVDRAQAAEAFPVVFDAYVPTRAGELDRPQRRVGRAARPDGGRRARARPRFYVCYERGGRIDGYADLPRGRHRPGRPLAPRRVPGGAVLAVAMPPTRRFGSTCSAST